jgi:putative DNA primase/helicase
LISNMTASPINLPHDINTSGVDQKSIADIEGKGNGQQDNNRGFKPEINIESIPVFLKEKDRWVLWTRAIRNEKPTKIPINPTTGNPASVTDQNTWAGFEDTMTAYHTGDCTGIGFVLGDGVIGIDWDHVFNPESETWNQEAYDEVLSIGSYGELSPSKTGAHVIALGVKPEGKNRSGNREMYDSGRFFTVTGWHIQGTPGLVQTPAPGALDTIQIKIEGIAAGSKHQGTPSLSHIGRDDPTVQVDLKDNEILDLCRHSSNSDKFKALMAGDFTGYASQSEADLALCGILSFFTKNVNQIDRLFRQSGLMRAKWGGPNEYNSYGTRTVTKALAGATGSYSSDYLRCSDGFHLTDMGNAERFIAQHRHNCRYCPTLKSWLLWNGKIWARDEHNEVMIKAKHTIRTIYGEAEQTTDDKLRTSLAKHALQSESCRSVEAIVKLAQSECAISMQDLDANPDLLNCLNGTLELSSLTFREHCREDFNTKSTNAMYDPDAECPVWEAHIRRIFAGDEGYMNDFRAYCGYLLLHDNPEQMMSILYGSGQNGKSTTMNKLSEMLGNYAVNISPESLTVKRSEGPRGDLVRLQGTRLATCSEGEEGVRFSESWIKQLTGTDKITVRKLYENEREFVPRARILFSTNHIPKIRGTDKAIWRRIWLFPFEVSIPDCERDMDIGKKLTAELPGILNWCVIGLSRYYANGSRLPKPEKVLKATTNFQNESDVVGQFIKDECILNTSGFPVCECKRKELYTTFKSWCEEAGEYPLFERKFADRIKEKGVIDGRRTSEWTGNNSRGTVRYWMNIRLKTDDEHMKEGGQDPLPLILPKECQMSRPVTI